MTDPLGKISTDAYDANGNVVSTADHAIGSVSAYGAIDGTFTAGTTAGAQDSTYGLIGSVTAWGDISGGITALTASGPILSQGTVSATVSPSATSVTSNATGLLDGVYPADPTFSLSDAQAALADAQASATTLKQSLAASEAQGASDWAAQQAALIGQLAQLQQDDETGKQQAMDAVSANNASVNEAIEAAQADDQAALESAKTATSQGITAVEADAATQKLAGQSALAAATTSISSEQSSLAAMQTKQKADATSLTSAEATAYDNERQQQATLLAGRDAQFAHQANQMWSNLGTDLWNATTFYRQIASEVTHTTLQVVSTAGNLFGPVGFIVGRVADLANAGLYYEEGEYLQAGFSAIAAFPLIGSAGSMLASDAENVSDGLLQAGATESAAVDNTLVESTILRGEQKLSGVVEDVENLAEGTAAAEGKCLNGVGCFVAGTEVITGYNATTRVFSQTPIENIHVGDQVLTRNQYDPNGPLEEQTVTATQQHMAYDLRDVTIQGADGGTRRGTLVLIEGCHFAGISCSDAPACQVFY